MSETAYLWLQAAVLLTIPMVLGILLEKIKQVSSLKKAHWMKLISLFSLIGTTLICGMTWKRTHERRIFSSPWDASHHQLFYPENPLIFEKGTMIDRFMTCLLFMLLIGALGYALIHQIRKMRMNNRLKHSLRKDDDLNEIMMRIKAQMNLDEPVSVSRSSEVSAPCLVMFADPVILIPEKMQDEKISWCIEHELIHLKHNDLMMLTVLRALEVLFWFHPLVSVFKKVYLEMQEMACDERITSKMTISEKVEYLKLLERTLIFAKDTEKTNPEICLARKTQIGRRAEKMMNASFSPGKQMVFTCCMVICVCSMTLSVHSMSLSATQNIGKAINPAESDYLEEETEAIKIQSLSQIQEEINETEWNGITQMNHGVYLSSESKNYTHFMGNVEEREEKVLMIAQLDENDLFQMTIHPAKDYFDLVICSRHHGCRVQSFDQDITTFAVTGFDQDVYCFMLKDKKVSGYYLTYEIVLAIR